MMKIINMKVTVILWGCLPAGPGRLVKENECSKVYGHPGRQPDVVCKKTAT